MSIPLEMPGPEVLVLVAAPLIALAALGLVWKAFRDGDRAEDATARMDLVWRSSPDRQPMLFAAITVRNPCGTTAIVSARARTASRLMAALSPGHDRRTVLLHRRRLGGYEILGAVAPAVEHTWLFPIHVGPTPALRVVVMVDQGGRRTRMMTNLYRIHRPKPSGNRTSPAIRQFP